jgi:hypothetical protein
VHALLTEMHVSNPPLVPPKSVDRDAYHETPEAQPLLESDDDSSNFQDDRTQSSDEGGFGDHASVRRSAQWERWEP